MEFAGNLGGGGESGGTSRPKWLRDNGRITRNLKQRKKENIKRKSIKQIKHFSGSWQAMQYVKGRL
jgi:hypothetical protein